MSAKTLDLDERFEPHDPARRFKAIVIVVGLHALLGYALVSGLAREGLKLIKKPLAAVVIQEVTLPPPPPPRKIEGPPKAPKSDAAPPFVPPPDVLPPVASTAPVIQSVATPPSAPVLMAPAPPAPLIEGPKRTSIGLACPRQVSPEMPRRAMLDGTEGVVKAQIHVKGSRILDVTILSGPRVFHAAVKEAMLQYSCLTDGGEVMAIQEFTFKLE